MDGHRESGQFGCIEGDENRSSLIRQNVPDLWSRILRYVSKSQHVVD